MAKVKPAAAAAGGERIYPLEHRAVADLIPYARNARLHSDAQVAQIAAAIREFGFTNPVLVDGENGVIAGHGRILAARKLGMETLPCIIVSGLSEAQKRALVLADNRIALSSTWDKELLALEIGELQELGADLALTGFDDKEIAKLTGGGDDMPDLSGESQLGDGLKFQVVVDCISEGDQAALVERLRGEGRECKPMTL